MRAGIGRLPQIRAAERGTVQQIVGPRVAPDRADDAVFNVVQAELAARCLEEQLAPRTERERLEFDVADREL